MTDSEKKARREQRRHRVETKIKDVGPLDRHDLSIVYSGDFSDAAFKRGARTLREKGFTGWRLGIFKDQNRYDRVDGKISEETYQSRERGWHLLSRFMKMEDAGVLHPRTVGDARYGCNPLPSWYTPAEPPSFADPDWQ